jgi:indole-3-glycerol phosphate synthase
MSFLSEILERKEAEVAARRRDIPESQLLELASQHRPPCSLYEALSGPGGPVRIVAEVKRASPSAGSIRAGLDAPAQAVRYERAGAAAVSVLTDGPGFGGSLADLDAVRERVEVPLLCKDFILNRYQLLEARAAGADAALLIVAALAPGRLRALLGDCGELGLSALVEVHDESELEVALDTGARIVGVNNRDLCTFGVDLATSERLLPLLPVDVRGIAESGVRGPEEVRRLRAHGAANFLVGEALVRAADAGALLSEMMAV